MIIACIILNYNDYETTLKLLKKIVDYESIKYIIIVDNNSTDNSYLILSNYISNKIHIIRTEKNGGYGYGNNFGINYAYKELHADYILITNPDVEFSNDLVNNLEKTLMSNNKNAIVSALPISPDGGIQFNAAWFLPSPLKYLLMVSTIFNKISKSIYYNLKYYNISPQLEVDCVAGSLLMIKADIMLKYGMYDESIFLYCEETVLGIKLKKAGYKTILLTKYNYIHHHSKSINKNIKSEYKKRKILYDSKIKVLKNYYGLNYTLIILSKLFLFICNIETICCKFIKFFIFRKNK